MQTLYKGWYFLLFLGIAFLSCKSGEKEPSAEVGTAASVVTPVTVTTVSSQPLSEYVELTATSSFLQKNYVKANVGGYIQSVNAQVGKYVGKGESLFSLKTKEAQSIGNSISKLDPSFRFSGVNVIRASGSGYITQLNHQAGDYVQDGEQLAIISDISSFVFIMSLPFEQRSYLINVKDVEVILPDSTKLQGVVTSTMPSVDPGSQTQSIVIKVPGATNLPENLIAKIRLLKTEKEHALSLPKAAILSNDIQTEFWVMKMIDSNTAAKVGVKKGIESKDRIEILSPVFSSDDKILVSGNYGLPDTAKVKIVQ